MNCGLVGQLFLIVGCGRSGTTLMKSILDAHDDLAVPAETFFFGKISTFLEANPELSYREAADHISTYWWIKDAGVGAEDILRYISSDSSAEHDRYVLFLALLQAMVSDSVSFLGEKTPSHIAVIDELFDVFPNLRVIQMVRDPRAVCASYKKAKIGTNQPLYVAREWASAYSVLKRNRSRNGYKVVMYEELVSNPDVVIKDVCDFLGVEFGECMLEFYQRDKLGFSREQKHHFATMKPVSSGRLDKWRDELSVRDIRFLESYLREEMDDLGMSPIYPRKRSLFLDVMLGEVLEFLHKNLVRRPRQVKKRLVAEGRMRAARD